MEKTNAMRIAERAGIEYKLFTYEVDESNLSGVHTADILGIPSEQLFKTLVLKGQRTGFFICCIPCSEELDLKKAARTAEDKNCDMLPVKSLFETTGYIRGGCSPIGMKKAFRTYIDETCDMFDEILISAGTRGAMLKMNVDRLVELVSATKADLIK